MNRVMLFQTRNGTSFSHTNLFHHHLTRAGRRLWMLWLNWHSGNLRR
jgi:hypothetical protein